MEEIISACEKVDNYRGYRYVVWLNDKRGYRCGYVQLPEGHALQGIPFQDIDEISSVGLSFNGRIKGLDGYYIGWDHNHLWDGIDEEAIIKYNPDNYQELLEYARNLHDGYRIYSTLSDVEKECHNVIDELITKNYSHYDKPML